MTSISTILLASEHAELMPDRVVSMTDEQLTAMLGEITVKNYVQDARRREAGKGDPKARRALAHMHRAEFLSERLTALATSLGARAVDAESAAYADRLRNTDFLSDIGTGSGVKSLSKLSDECRGLLEKLDESKEEALSEVRSIAGSLPGLSKSAREVCEAKINNIYWTRREMTQELRLISSGLSELTDHSEVFCKNPLSDQTRQTVLEIMREKATSKEEFGAAGSADQACQIIGAQMLADTHLFLPEDILKELLGGDRFVDSLKAQNSALARTNWKEQRDMYRESYFLMGRSSFNRFVDNTLGMVLYAYPKSSNKPGQWSTQDVRDLQDFVSSRYAIVHRVMEGLAHKEQNPVGMNLPKLQSMALMLEILRSSLYPDYRMDIRVGIGGTEERDALVRVGGYVMNALDVLMVFQAVQDSISYPKKANLPSLTVVSGASLATRQNGLDPIAAQETTLKIFSYLRQFAAEYYPDLKSPIAFSCPSEPEVFDNDLYKTLLATARVVSDPESPRLNAWKETLNCAENEVAGQKTDRLSALLKTLTGFSAKKNEGRLDGDKPQESALRYTVAHLMPKVFQTVTGPEPTPPVWKIGCMSEKYFDEFAQALAWFLKRDEYFILANAGSGSKLLAGLCTTTSIGRNPPPYYQGDNGTFDPHLGELLCDLRANKLSDEETVRRVRDEQTGPASDMRKLLKHPRVGGGDISRGWENYKPFLMKYEHP